ncbi:MAG TPA: conjugal transfer protein TrbL family protein [Chloroflexota bacterium]|nr:conjugal transfer protein TrbL family protein [Chloroflexota bacterium]
MRESADGEPGGGWLDFRRGMLGDLIESAGDLFTEGLTSVLQAIADAARRVLDGVLSSSANFIIQTPAAVSYDSPTVRGLWGLVRGIANAALVLVVVWSGFNLMVREHLGTPYHSALELFPRIAIAALLVNTSLWWTQLAIDLNNVLCGALGQASLPSWEAAGAGAQAFANVVLAVAYLITALFLLLQMLIRLALVDVLIVLAPLAFVLWVLPQTQGWSQLWTSTFASTVFTQLVQVATLKLGGLLLAELTPMAADAGLVSLFLSIALMALTLKVPTLMKGRLGDGLSFARYLAYRQMAGALGGAAGRGGAGGASSAGRAGGSGGGG